MRAVTGKRDYALPLLPVAAEASAVSGVSGAEHNSVSLAPVKPAPSAWPGRGPQGFPDKL